MFSLPALLLLEALAGTALAGPAVCATASLPLSCQNTTVQDTCCFVAPGGALLQTQFWDADPATGPADSWTAHGLWPDYCDGTYPQFCDTAREVTNATAIVRARSPSLLTYMQTYWKDYQGDDESLWEHEFNKHGTCISTLDPTCYTDYTANEEVFDFYNRTAALFASLPSYDWLAAAGIVPSSTATYTRAAIQAALSAKHGHDVVINCDGSKLNELWYHFNVRGSVQTGEFVAVDPVGSSSTCPSTGIKYLPKKSTGTSTGTATATKATATASATGSAAALSGAGYVHASTSSSSSAGFLISSGAWYSNSGTAATFTATANADGLTYTLKTSKGLCAVQSDTSLSCSSSVSAGSSFGYDGAWLTYSGSNTFYAAAVPSGSSQDTVYTSSKAVSLQLYWVAK